MATQKELVSQLIADVAELKLEVASLKEKAVSVTPMPTPAPAPAPAPVPASVANGKTNSPNYFPIPPDYVDTVDLVLNKNFKIDCEPLPDSPAFQFTITVPEKYSSMTPAQRDMIHDDLRVKVISFSDGVNGVRLFAEKVYETFNPDTKFRIVEDRPFAFRSL